SCCYSSPLLLALCSSSYPRSSALLAFPTRRSSALDLGHQGRVIMVAGNPAIGSGDATDGPDETVIGLGRGVLRDIAGGQYQIDRSEEHTSELQSRENLVCRLLLEKKNKSQHTVVTI